MPTKLRVERWGFSFRELLDDPVGRAHFQEFLQKEFSGEKPQSCAPGRPLREAAAWPFLPGSAQRRGTLLAQLAWEPVLGRTSDLAPRPLAENLSFWEACEELRFGGQAQVPALVDTVYQ